MSNESLVFLMEQLPALFSRGVSALEDHDSDRAEKTLEDIRSARGAVRIIAESPNGDSHELWLIAEDGSLRSISEKPDGYRVRFAVAIPSDALDAATEELKDSGFLDSDKTAIRFAAAASGRLDALLEPHTLRFHLVVADVPDLGDVQIRAALHDDDPPEKPEFSATLNYDDLEALRDGELKPQALMMGGKLRLAGDYSPALQLGMQLMQLAN